MRPLPKLIWVEIKLFVREPLTVVFSLAFPLIVLFVLAEVFGNTPDPEGVMYRGVGAINFYVPAYLGLVMASVGLVGIPVHLAGYRERGVLRRFRASAVPLRSILGTQIIVSFAIALASSLLIILAVALVYTPHMPQSIPGVLAAFVLGTISFASLGLLLGAILPSQRSAQLAGMVLWFSMMLLSGAGPPPEVMTEAMRRIGDVLPLKHIVVLLQDPWLGFGWNWTETVVVGGLLAGSVVLSLRFFRWE